MPVNPRPRSALVALLSLVLSITLVAPVAAVDPVTPNDPATPQDPVTPHGPVTPLDHAEFAPPPTDAAFVADQLLVRFDPTTSPAARGLALRAVHAAVNRDLAAPNLALVDLPNGSDVPGAVTALQRMPGVSYAEPNYVYAALVTPNDPRFGELWGLDNAADDDIDAPEAWSITTGSSKVVVAVVDSGVDYAHPDLAPNIWTNPGESVDGKDNDGNGLVDDIRGWDFVAEDNDPMDQNGHGTHVAGTIGAKGNNGAGITGVNWNVRIMAVRAGNAAGSLTNANIVDSFGYACDEGARVVNGSFGGPAYSQAMRDAIDACPQALFVFAAGNGGSDGVGDDNDSSATYPCNYNLDNIVCVAATGPYAGLAGFSNYGANNVDLAAPGVGILSASYLRILFTDGFESGFGHWTAGKVSGISWSRTTEAAAGGTHSATDSAGSNYANGSDTWFETASPINLAGGTGCALDFALDLETEQNYDYLVLYGSKNGGSTWSVIDGGIAGDNALTGSTGGFRHFGLSLQKDGFDGSASFDLLFRLVSDSSVALDGAHVDDVMVRCRTASHGTNDYLPLSGTSMATPHVAGVAALVLAAHPNLTTETLRQALLDGVDPLPALSGLVATGGRLNARGALDAVETVRPVAKPPSQRLISNSTPTTSGLVPMRVSWAAATDAEPSSGIYRYTLQQRQKSGSTWGAWQTLANLGGRSRTVKLAPGEHQFRVRAEDRAGNRSRWKAGSQFVLADPQASPEITFGGTWATQTSSSFFDGSTRYTGARGRTADLAFNGSEVAWVATRGPNRGRAKVYVDGVLVQTVDLYRTSQQFRRVVFRTSWSTSGSHTIMIKVTSKNAASSGKRVDLDAYLAVD